MNSQLLPKHELTDMEKQSLCIGIEYNDWKKLWRNGYFNSTFKSMVYPKGKFSKSGYQKVRDDYEYILDNLPNDEMENEIIDSFNSLSNDYCEFDTNNNGFFICTFLLFLLIIFLVVLCAKSSDKNGTIGVIIDTPKLQGLKLTDEQYTYYIDAITPKHKNHDKLKKIKKSKLKIKSKNENTILIDNLNKLELQLNKIQEENKTLQKSLNEQIGKKKLIETNIKDYNDLLDLAI